LDQIRSIYDHHSLSKSAESTKIDCGKKYRRYHHLNQERRLAIIITILQNKLEIGKVIR
jgi:hypothetical protein